MSFKAFIYYCAICGGWAAFAAWLALWAVGAVRIDNPFLKTPLIAGFLGLLVAAGVGVVDAMLNAVGFQRVLRVAVCMGVGLVGGAFGGLIGEALHSFNPYLLLIGWLLVGVAIGASLGVFDLLRAATTGGNLGVALKKTLNGVYGGFLGGFVGGVFFGLLYANEATRQALPNGSLAIGLVILGMCIGLLIGLAQVVLKEAWLKVEAGFRAGREVMLSKDDTTIGRAESCDIGLFGDGALEKLHARIQRKNNQYLLADAATAGGTYLNDKPVRKPTPLRNGDKIRVGNCVLRFGDRAKR
jgi:MFS family permease